MTSLDTNWRKLVVLISQQHDVTKYKDTIYESFNLYPPSRPALLDLFSDIIVDKYIHSYIHQRNNHTNDLEEVIKILIKEINGILDKEFDSPDYVKTALKSKVSHYSGYGFNSYVCQWVLIVLLKITAKYEQILAINDSVPTNEKMRWNQVPIIMDLLDILCKILNSQIMGHEAVAILMKNVAANRGHLLWVVRHLGERHPSGIVDKVIACILGEFIPQQEYSKLQSCILVLSQLGPRHARQLQVALLDRLRLAVEDSAVGHQQQLATYQTLIYFCLLLASRSDLPDLASASLTLLGRLLSLSTPKQLEQFFLQQNFGDNILRSYFHMAVNILINSVDPEVAPVLEYLVHHCHPGTPAACCSPPFARLCARLVDQVCAKLLIQCHTSRPPNSAIITSVVHKADFWTQKLVREGSVVAGKLLCCAMLRDSTSIGEDVLVSILTTDPHSPQEKAGLRAALAIFPRILDESELAGHDVLETVVVRTLCVAQTFPEASRQRRVLASLLSLIADEARMQSSRRRLARTLSASVDLLLLLAATEGSEKGARLAAALLQKMDAPSDEGFSVPAAPAFRPVPDMGRRFRAWPIFISVRVARCVSILLGVLLEGRGHLAAVRALSWWLARFLEATERRHAAPAVQVVLRACLGMCGGQETAQVALMRRTLRPGWCGGGGLVSASGVLRQGAGRLCAPAGASRAVQGSQGVAAAHWQALIEAICLLGGPPAAAALQAGLTTALAPAYHLAPHTDLNAVATLWRRVTNGPLVWSLLQLVAREAPLSLEGPSQTLEALLAACEHLWSTADCPRRRLRRISPEGDLLAVDSRDPAVAALRAHWDLADARSPLSRATVALLECVGARMPLASELAVLVPFLGGAEVRTVATHLGHARQRPRPVPDPQPQAGPAQEGQDGQEEAIVAMVAVPLAPTPLTGTFSWETLLPALVHSRVHLAPLHGHFCRLLAAPADR